MVVSKVDQKFCQKSAILLPLLVYLLLQLAIFLICYHFWPTVQATPSRRIHLVSVGNYATSRFFVHFYYHSFNRPCLLVGPDPLLIFVMGILSLPARYHLSTSIPSTKHRTYIMSQIISALVHKYLSQKLERTYYNQKKKILVFSRNMNSKYLQQNVNFLT